MAWELENSELFTEASEGLTVTSSRRSKSEVDPNVFECRVFQMEVTDVGVAKSGDEVRGTKRMFIIQQARSLAKTGSMDERSQHSWTGTL